MHSMRAQRDNAIFTGRQRVYIMLLVAIVAGVSGLLVGSKLFDAGSSNKEMQRVDEILGLGDRTGFVGDLGLSVEPLKLSVNSGDPLRVKLVLVNNGRKPVLLNGWLIPVDAGFDNNQYPLKVKILRNGRPVTVSGNELVAPPHRKNDFFRLNPGKKKTVTLDLSKDGKWRIETPGDYTVEIWYESYLTGKYSGVKAWTGMTNHVVVRTTVYPARKSAK